MKILMGLLLVVLALNVQAQWYSRLYGVENIKDLNQAQLNYALQKAESNIKTGKILFISGIGAFTLGTIIAVNGAYNWTTDVSNQSELDKYTYGSMLMLAGIGSTAVGIPFWIVGASRRNKIEVALIQYNSSSLSGYRHPGPPGLRLTIHF